MKLIDLTGRRFGRWVVLKRVDNNKARQTRWLCECNCGTIKEIEGASLKRRHTKSCGCLRLELVKKRVYKHGYAMKGNRTDIYNSWMCMKQRCNNPETPDFKYYGGRGIKVCKRWCNFKNFLNDMGEKPKGLTIERLNNDKGYSPDNCKWATRKEQSRNNRNTKLNPLKVQIIKKLLKESKLMAKDIAEIFHVSVPTIYKITSSGTWSDIIYTPVG